MENDQIPDPYEAVLADLRAQKERIESTIALLESLRASGVAAPGAGLVQKAEAKPKGGTRPEIGAGAFLGMTIVDASKKLLGAYHRQMQTPEIVRELERGGLILTSADKVNTVGSILLRRFYTIGDVVRISRGVWGLQEWYPGRKFPGARDKAEEGDKGPDADLATIAEGNVTRTEPTKPVSGAAPWLDKIGERMQEEGDV